MKETIKCFQDGISYLKIQFLGPRFHLDTLTSFQPLHRHWSCVGETTKGGQRIRRGEYTSSNNDNDEYHFFQISSHSFSLYRL